MIRYCPRPAESVTSAWRLSHHAALAHSVAETKGRVTRSWAEGRLWWLSRSCTLIGDRYGSRIDPLRCL